MDARRTAARTLQRGWFHDTFSFYALAKDMKDEELKKRILAKVYRLTATN